MMEEVVTLGNGNTGSLLQVDLKTLNSLPYHDPIIERVVSRIQGENAFSLADSTLGLFFEQLIKEEERKDLGQFYTPQEAVDYMINFLKIKKDSKILDPTCGCGVFLVTAYNFLRKINKRAIENIYGVDLNDSATKITRINLWLRDVRNKETLKILENNIRIGNSIVQDKKIDSKAFNWDKEFSKLKSKGGFDFIIGNPPYVTLKNGRDYNVTEPAFQRIANGHTNSASLVMARSFEQLKEGGVMAFVLPKSLLRAESYSKLRSFILEKSRILHIYDLGSFFKDVRGEQIILFIKKTSSKKQIAKNKILIKIFKNKEKSLPEQEEFFLPQSIFQEYNNNFLIYEDSRYYDLINKLGNKGESLENLSDIFRGLSINPSSSIISQSPSKTNHPIIKGNNISKFSYNKRFYIKDSSVNREKVKRLRRNKIVLQNIFSSEAGIISAIDNKKEITFDTVTNIVIEDKRIDLNYLSGLLNSKLINFYLIYAIYNGSRLTMHTDRIYMGRLPIMIPKKENQKKISEIVSRLRRVKDKKRLLNDLDKLVYKLYGINKKEQLFIDKALSKIMSQRSSW